MPRASSRGDNLDNLTLLGMTAMRLAELAAMVHDKRKPVYASLLATECSSRKSPEARGLSLG